MQKLTGVWTNFLRSHSFELSWLLWPGAEDKALRGRNLSAVFRTLNRQVGKPPRRLPSCAHTWRVENQCDKSTLQMFQGHQLVRERRPKNPFHSPLKELLTKQSNCLSIFPGQVHPESPSAPYRTQMGTLMNTDEHPFTLFHTLSAYEQPRTTKHSVISICR
jgi:hypothetical protein